MSKQVKEFDPMSVIIQVTSEDNLYYAKSSNGFDYYGLYFTGPDAVVCSCKAAQEGMNCRHRKALLARYNYVTDLSQLDDVTVARIRRREQAYWREIERKSGDEWERDAVRNLWSDGPEAA